MGDKTYLCPWKLRAELAGCTAETGGANNPPTWRRPGKDESFYLMLLLAHIQRIMLERDNFSPRLVIIPAIKLFGNFIYYKLKINYEFSIIQFESCTYIYLNRLKRFLSRRLFDVTLILCNIVKIVNGSIKRQNL